MSKLRQNTWVASLQMMRTIIEGIGGRVEALEKADRIYSKLIKANEIKQIQNENEIKKLTKQLSAAITAGISNDISQR